MQIAGACDEAAAFCSEHGLEHHVAAVPPITVSEPQPNINGPSIKESR
jgi:hypothetical protein